VNDVNTENNSYIVLYRDWSRSKLWLLDMFKEAVAKMSSTRPDTLREVNYFYLSSVE